MSNLSLTCRDSDTYVLPDLSAGAMSSPANGDQHEGMNAGERGASARPSSETVAGKMSQMKLAIVGMAGRFPSSGDHHKFWKLLMDGIDAHREV